MVGIVPASEDVELAGPQALSADGQGNLFVLDQVNGRILQFDPKQQNTAPDILKMPGDTLMPLLLALMLAAGFVGLLTGLWGLVALAGVLAFAVLLAWLWPERALAQTTEPRHG